MLASATEKLSRAVSEQTLDARRWKQLIALIAGLALLVRLVLIATTGGGFNLRIFNYFSELIVQGVNPYDAPVGGEFDPKYGDNPPPEMLLFAGLLKIHNSPDTLRVFFALVDVAVIAMVGLLYPRSRTFRANFVLFYAFNPLLLEAWTAFADDKAVIMLCTIGVLIGLQTGRLAVSWVAAAALGAFKWISVVFAPALAIHTAQMRSRRWLIVACLGFLAVIVLAQLPFAPESLDTFGRRSDRIGINPPIHAAVTQLLAEAGLYDPLIARIFAPLSLVVIYVLYLLRRLDIKDVIVLTLFCSYVALPDEGFNRMLQITMPFLFVIGMSALRWLMLWIVSGIASIAVLVEFRDFDFSAVESLFGSYGSVRHVLFVNAVMAVVVFWYLRDRLGQDRHASVSASPQPALDS